MKINRNKVLLINPQHHKNWKYGESIFSFPIGILFIGTLLKRSGFEPVIIDSCVDSDYWSILERHISDALFVGISAMTPQVPHAMEIARKIRNLNPNTSIIWGGIHPSLYPDSCRDVFCDIVVLGEGDQSCVDIARAIQAGSPFEKIDGIAFEKKGKVHVTAPRKLLDVDTLPHVDYSLIDIEKYIITFSLQELRMVRVIPVHAARGCPWHCTFCINTTLNHERRYRPRNPDLLMAEVKKLVQKYELEMVSFQDEEFFAHRKRVIRVLENIEAEDLSHIQFNATSRINHFRPGYIDRDLLRRLKRCGFGNLVFGFESGSARCLELIQKEITVDQGLYAAKMLAEEDFQAVWGFIMALPGETAQDLIKTLYLMEKIRKYSDKNYFIGPQIFRPYPGSILYQEALKFGLNEPADLSDWAAQQFTEEGWIGSSELLWIPEEDRDFIDFVNFISPVYYNRQFLRESFAAKSFHTVLRFFFGCRLKFGFWKFPVEHKIRNFLVKKLLKA